MTTDLRETPIRELLSNAPTIISVKKTDSISDALKLLKEKDINTLGVYDDQGCCFVGLVTVFDIMTYICLGSYKENDTPDEIKAGKSLDLPIGDVTGVFHEETNKIWSFEEDLPMVQLLEPMSKGVHRGVVVMADGTFKLITQHDVVKFGIDNKHFFTDIDKTMDELGLGNPAITHVCSIPSNKSALHAFRKMEMLNHTALPVVDPKSGSIISTISASDIRYCSPDNINEILKDSLDYIKYCHKDTIKPLTCKGNAIVGSVMAGLIGTHHKHIWVIDDEDRPISSVTLSDIINRMQGINEDLQSRALAVYGRGAMNKLFATKVLISGMNGFGAEIAKNVILANVNSVTLHDTKNTIAGDLNSHFYLSESDIGSNRAKACVSKLAELNPSVRVTATTTETLSDALLLQHNIVVLIETSNKEAIRINEFCRTRNISFIKTDINGLAGYVFCDFGKGFEVIDVNGEQPTVAIVQEINEKGRVQCVNEEMLDLQDGDYVSFTEVKGAEELNNKEFQVENVTPYSFYIKDAPECVKKYETGGIVTQIKKPKIIDFKSYEESLKNCDVLEPPDYSKFDRHHILHSAFKALDLFKENNKRLTRPTNSEDVEELTKYWVEFNNNSEYVADLDSNKKVLQQFSHGAGSVINPMAAAFGGIVGQEVIKAATSKFHPINQWFYLDAFEVYPDEFLDPSEYEAQNSRYDAQIQLLGKSFQEKLSNLNYFLVGSGALGCEYLKNFAMTGLGCGPKGKITVTDDDVIEKSNLSRQFLFRNWDIHKSKSECASRSARAMNPNINIDAKQDRVSPTTENIFNDSFWESLDGVCNALDNIKARLYVDSKCIFYEKSLLESGTLGPKCNSQVIIPHKTRHYGDQPDQPDKEIPVCVLHLFPHNIQHCLAWGRSEFNGNFEVAPAEVSKYKDTDNYVDSLKEAQIAESDIKEKLQVIGKVLKVPCKTFEDCITWARLEFEDNFVNKIMELTHNFPKDSKNKSGAPFWSPPKRYPTPVKFDVSDPMHMQYIISGANLKANTFNVPKPKEHRKPEYFKDIVSKVVVPEFVPTKKKIKTEDDEQDETDSYSVEELQKNIPPLEKLNEITMIPEDFEKDDDTNFHMDFIGASANLRARNYEIEEVDKLKAKLIAGRIIPAIATATALATGLVTLELFKLVNNRPMGTFDTVGAYRSSSNNLALPQFSFFEPMTPVTVVDHVEKSIPDPQNHPEYEEEEDIIAYPSKHTIWDKIYVKIGNDFTLQDLIDHFTKEHELKTEMVTVVSPKGKAILVYSSFSKHTHDRLNVKFADLVKERTGEDLLTKKYYIPEILFSKNGDTVENPPVVLVLK